jgi:hypothetical protein
VSYYGRIDLGTGCLANLTDGGDGMSGFSEETRRKMSVALTGNTHCVGRVLSVETRRKMSESSTGRPKSAEHRKHLSESKMGKPAPAVVESNIRRRSENPSKAALASRKYRAAKKARESCLK